MPNLLEEIQMLRIGVVAGFSLLVFGGSALADQYVNGYCRTDGVCVQGYWRSSPDDSYNNNWSVSPNINPYTGEQGTLAPTWNDRPPRNCPLFGGCTNDLGF